MEQETSNNSKAASPLESVRTDTESFRTIPQASEPFVKLPNVSERFRNLPHVSEAFGNLPNVAERKENHTLSVREVSRLFEAAGVARTERSITNWCRKNAQGVARLDAYFDPNEGKYFITPESVDLAIGEEKAKAEKNNAVSESFGNVPKASEESTKTDHTSETDAAEVKALKAEILDLKITNKGKDMMIEQLVNERNGFVEKLMDSSHRIGELETQLLAAPNKSRKLEVRGDTTEPVEG